MRSGNSDPFEKRINQKLCSERGVREYFLNRSHRESLILEKSQEAYPDLHMRDMETGERIFVEVEHVASNFLSHRHHEQDVENDADYIVCGTNDLENEQTKIIPEVEVIALDERFGADILHTPHYRIARYESDVDRRKSMALRVERGNIEARMEDQTKSDSSSAVWKDDSKGTQWMPVDDFVQVFSKVSHKHLNGRPLGEQVFSGDVDYDPLLEYGRDQGELYDEDDRVVIASHEYYHPRKEEKYLAKAVLRVNTDGKPPNFRIQHFKNGGSQFISQRTTLYSSDEFRGVFGRIREKNRVRAFVEGDPQALIEEVERKEDVSISERTSNNH